MAVKSTQQSVSSTPQGRRPNSKARAIKQKGMSSRISPLALGITLAFIAGLAALVGLNLVSSAIAGLYLALSLITFVLYGLDKSAAKSGQWRVAEARLHLFQLAGGWPGALLAQQWFRHKTRKQPFQFIFWCTVLVNCGVLVWLVMTDRSLTELLPPFTSFLGRFF